MAESFSVRVQGMPEVLTALGELQSGAEQIGLSKDSITSELPYSAAQNYGFYRNGRLARRAGPTLFFEAGARAIEASALDQLAPAVRKGAGAVRSAWAVVVRRGITEAQSVAPVRTGRLRQSIHAA